VHTDQNVAKKRSSKIGVNSLKTNYTLGEHLKQEGVEKIIKMLVVGKNTHSVYLQTAFDNPKEARIPGAKNP
jgi:hypothetical protein